MPSSATSGGGGGKGSAGFDLGAAISDRGELIKSFNEVQNGLQRVLTTEPLFRSFNALFTEKGGTVDAMQQIDSGTNRVITSLANAAAEASKLKLNINDTEFVDLDKIQGATDALGIFRSQLESIGVAYDNIGERAIPNVTGAIIEGINAFGQYAKDGIKSMKDLGRAVLASAAVAIKSFIQTGVAAAVSNAFRNPAGIIPPIGLALATAAGLAASGLFSSVIGKIGIPKLAGGGIAYGNSIVNVGEYPGARTNPEVIAPLDKLKKIIGGGGNGGFIAETVISGSDLRVILSRADRTYTRYTTG